MGLSVLVALGDLLSQEEWTRVSSLPSFTLPVCTSSILFASTKHGPAFSCVSCMVVLVSAKFWSLVEEYEDGHMWVPGFIEISVLTPLSSKLMELAAIKFLLCCFPKEKTTHRQRWKFDDCQINLFDGWFLFIPTTDTGIWWWFPKIKQNGGKVFAYNSDNPWSTKRQTAKRKY